MDTIEAARWCATKTFKGKFSLPQVTSMDKRSQSRAVELLRMSSGLDQQENEELREPFTFLFSLQEDHEAFCEEIMDRRHMQAFSAYEP